MGAPDFLGSPDWVSDESSTFAQEYTAGIAR